MPIADTPTLLALSRGASSERARRRLLPGALGALEQQTHEALLAATLAAGREAGCRLAVSSPTPRGEAGEIAWIAQSGTDFGSRLEASVARCAALGPGPLLIAASDVPGLSSGHLLRAISWLAEDPDRVVLGPSPDGGMYLVAFARPIPHLATAARWCRRDTLASFVRTLAALGRPVAFLPPLRDLDRRTDLDRWLAGRSAAELFRTLRRDLRAALSTLLRPAASRVLGCLLVGFESKRAGRAPPPLLSPA